MTGVSVLEVEGLTVRFRVPRGAVQALTDVTFSLGRGEILTVVGESGSGKTVLAHAITRLLPLNAEVTGRVRLDGEDVLALSEAAMQRLRARRLALIPQSPGAALNPVRRVGPLLLEIARVRGLPRDEARARLGGALRELGLAFDAVAGRYPHQLSGGMQQRVVNAAAMAAAPDVVIADEPTHGLDADLVETTARQLQAIAAHGAALLVITHDLRLARRLGGRTAVVYASYLVELRPAEGFFTGPAHPYGRALLRAMPEHGGVPIPGLSPELTALPRGCPFAPRCPDRAPVCEEAVPPPAPLPDGGMVRCAVHAGG
ncbi:MAG TPA: ABC transporter ATP-binding protein [Dehalococcoidia bacterium]